MVETDADTLTIPTSEHDGTIGPEDWGTVEYDTLTPTDGVAVLPRVVRNGEPRNFMASVAVRPSGPRIGGDR
ncbi:hypothetical protein [Natrialba sp. SSL1]|uniref:hypothetical protein n=1 Tax=Natrialba sp. SSL1 TaxID=1869245 RepID=UPI0008F86D6E|nr:hypothetical protein [Natrialba sp. SSL1]OIB55760.1 hypothetical protein BBD46_02815 [Natrialba sp. SSL1]